MAMSTLGASPGVVNLETRHAVDRARWGANLGRILGQRRQIIAECRADRCEPITGELHAIARIAGEPHDDACDGFGVTPSGAFYGVRHGHLPPAGGWLRCQPLFHNVISLSFRNGRPGPRTLPLPLISGSG
jgi:hypothetical protein